MLRLKELREDKGIAIRKLSEKLEDEYNLVVSPSQLSFYENEKRRPRDESIWNDIADYFGVSVPYLLGYDDGTVGGVLELAALVQSGKLSIDSIDDKDIKKAVSSHISTFRKASSIVENLKSESDELAEHARNNDISDEIKSASNNENLANYYHDLKKIMFQISVKENFSNAELSELQKLKSELLTLIDFLYEQRLMLDKIDTNKNK
ncbi:DNA-binding protein [Streptococcus satellite phage Javan250]|uniref:helix-turn-helix domain-containing protein n=1 Tax=Streptococcus halotolerans TaxID=1814128 RepID=UPI0007873FD1|nr:helix-turn-helix transcriptional regulator [Streptococcus halotolerans]QBX08354.1 DNA-binding protein [Streptococcus satellite phage Javan250]